ncbi:hypothetical protein [Frigoriglobus tundricola]|uniref:Uncharacterized protein n=1 Tax=Frigoriglobus tundricola TaxID=2774151 RepID=A0A6M5YKQ7_9BACT|nr:hypothetical protein [Frigoriglobus tundricola]QJW94154.1 hypothetical protein FTUN_1673 [Frigoriglobus tundricola]
MTPQNRLRISIAAGRYLDALERDDQAAMDALWDAAAQDPDLLTAFRDIHAGLVEEQQHEALSRTTNRVTAAVAEHLTSAVVRRPSSGPMTVADVAEELFRRTPDRLSAAAHELNERLRSARDPLPADMGLSDLVAWAEARYGAAPAVYWKAFREAAIRLEIQQASEVEYQLAARRAPKPGEGK